MRFSLTLLVTSLMALACAPAGSQEAAPRRTAEALPQKGAEPALQSKEQQTSYALGWDIGRNYSEMFRDQGLAINVMALLSGFRHGITGEDTLISEQRCAEILRSVSEEIEARQLQQMRAQGEQNRKTAESFFAKNKDNADIVARPSGLQYQVLREGSGPRPTASDQVTVHYHGTLLNGEVFDSSVERQEPVTFAVGQVIPGWQEALKLMPEGAKWKLFIPPNLAYGERGSPPVIGPNAGLIFDVELIKVR